MKCVFNSVPVVSLFSLILAGFSLSGCGVNTTAAEAQLSQIDPSPRPSGSIPSPSPSVAPGDSPQVISGWLPEYSSAVEENVAGNYPALLSLASSRMKVVCPNWDRLDRGGREKFWSSLTYAIAGPESGRNRTSIYRETTMSIDQVTGQQIRSEGLLQLSYTDVVSYKYKGGDISWENDRAMAQKDYAAGTSHGNPNRTILNAYANLNLGVFIMYRQLLYVHPTESLETTLGHYWSTMRSTNSPFKTVLSGLRTKIPECGT